MISCIDLILLAIIILWVLYWKGRALWVAGRRGDKKWFIVLLIVNTLGLLEMIYVLTRKKEKEVFKWDNI